MKQVPEMLVIEPIPAMNHLEELDPTHKIWHNTMGGPGYAEVVGKHSGWCNDGHFRDMCSCDAKCEAAFLASEDEYSEPIWPVYEEAKGG